MANTSANSPKKKNLHNSSIKLSHLMTVTFITQKNNFCSVILINSDHRRYINANYTTQFGSNIMLYTIYV